MSGELWILVAAFLLSALVISLFARFANRLPGDAPNDRSLHAQVVPRGGGIAIWAGFLPAAILAPPQVPGPWPAWLFAWLLVAGVSLADDVRGAGVALRLAVQLVAATLVCALLADAGAFGWLGAIAAVLAIAWGANLYNFMDGSDGLAGVMTVCGFAAYALGAVSAGVSWTALAAVALAGVPFLWANRPPARIFMGDVGAVPLGFLASSIGIAGAVSGWWPAWFPLLVFLPFLADASVTLVKRVLSGERVWQAHRSHYYQRLNASGAGHRGTLSIHAATMLACSALALACLRLAPEQGWLALAAAALAHGAGFFAIDYHLRNMTSR